MNTCAVLVGGIVQVGVEDQIRCKIAAGVGLRNSARSNRDVGTGKNTKAILIDIAIVWRGVCGVGMHVEHPVDVRASETNGNLAETSRNL